ncbi:kynureninase [Puia dinghuensis]|uniref:Kynureninase n=1 Tax=Puia dinghuensis TaxID=1792502 RepID=A0A8J2XW70_9BACT|nr:kynureninase [Puia dinghuensis]GGB21604.1 kynureninase [Puia dinghuensis]
MPQITEPSLAYAQQKDREDKLQGFRSRFVFPKREGGEMIYFCGNSLGLQPVSAEESIRQELIDWRELAIEGYWKARNPWMTYPQTLRGPLARIAGCLEEEVTVMNALTVNLHLLLLTFYRPTPQRYKIIMEAGAFPSDQYAMETQVKWHGFDPKDAVIEVAPRKGESLIREEDLMAAIEREKGSLALVLFGGLNYYTGQVFDMATITAATHRAGAVAGFDLAHAVGNVPLALHDWGVDFAVWCSYKYLNGGPGAAGGAFIHQRHVQDKTLVRLGGWWGNDSTSRFQMDHQSLSSGQATGGGLGGFIPKPTAEGWSMSTAQVFNMACLRASLAIFEEAGIERLVAKSRELTGYLASLLESLEDGAFRVITPAEPESRGAQLSLHFGAAGRGKIIQQQLMDEGVVTDYREPGVVRVAPAPLYNSFEDVYRFCHILRQLL